MEKAHLFEKVKALISKGQTREAFDFLRQQTIDPKSAKTVALIEGEYSQLRQKELKGTLSFQEIQLQRNRINDKLLALFNDSPSPTPAAASRARWWMIGIPIAVLLLGWGIWRMLNPMAFPCPEFQEAVNRKVLVIPFVNVGGDDALPHVILRDRINQLAQNNELSTNAQVCAAFDNMTMDKAPRIAKLCTADLLVWGTFSAWSDSINLILQYFFANEPNWNNSGELVKSKDVTSLQTGKMLKNLDDAIFSLCGVIAFRDGKNELAKKWFDKVVVKEDMDRKMLEMLE